MPVINIRNADYFYELSGKGDETLVFSHGFLMDSEMFRYQTDFFKDKYRILTFDWRSQGKSEPVCSGFDMDELYLDAVKLLEKLHLKKVHWIGVSMGGFIGMRIAARKPDLLKSLVLVDTSDEAEIFSKKLRWGLLAYVFRYFGPGPVMQGIQKAIFGKTSLVSPGFKPVLDEYAQKWTQLNRRAIFQIAWKIFNRKPVTDELKNIKIPTLVVVGEEDVARPYDEAVRLMGRIKNARLQIIPESGHSSPLEQPEVFNMILENFLNRIST